MRLHPAWSLLLWPFSLLYGLAVWGRVSLYRAGVLKRKRLPGVVISVGNVSVGGTGKTPLVIWLADRLSAEGKRVGILSRGYKGAGQGSDEVEMMRRRWAGRIPVAAGPDRYASGMKLASEGIDWFLLDDGFQHLALERNVEIVVLDSSDPLDGAHLLPAGRLREPLSALRRADIVVITRTSEAKDIEAEIRPHTGAPIFYAYSRLSGLSRFVAGELEPAASKAGQGSVYAFCGIGNPAAFFNDLTRWGLTVAGRKSFRDHYRYTQADADRLESEAQRAQAAALICTEKDAMNLGGVEFRKLPVDVCRIELEVSAGLVETVLKIAAQRRARTA
jgi:tetraacyldisaccharide 4'-kinase